MRIVCPSCDAAYQVPEAVLARAPVMRCARCGHDWSPVAAAPPPGPAAPPPAAPPTAAARPAEATAAAPRPAADPPPAEAKPPNPLPLRLAWAASLLLLLGAATGAVLWREALVAAWPPLARLFVTLGLAV